MSDLETAKVALRKLLSAVNNAEVLGEWSALEINHGTQKKTRALIDADVEFARQALAALDAAPSVRVPDEWQPIETAPKEQKILVAFKNPNGLWRRTLATYYGEESLESEHTASGFADEGWYEYVYSLEEQPWLDGDPTHWAPCPAPPQETVK